MAQRNAAKTPPKEPFLEIRLPYYGAVDGGSRQEAFREALVHLGIEGRVTIKPTADVIGSDSFATTSGSITLQLHNTEESKKFWESPSGWEILKFITMILIFFCQEYRLDIRDAEGQKLMKEIVRQVEEFWLVHKDQQQPTPKRTPEKRQRRARGTGSLKGRAGANRRKD
jgi:hypothetical protein